MSKLEQTLESTARMLCVEIKSNVDSKFWYLHNNIHRDFDKPAMFRFDISREWFQYGKLHRDHNKPAVICTSGDVYWFWYGNLYRKENEVTATYVVKGEQ